jgi:type VI secretion system protein ImpH
MAGKSRTSADALNELAAIERDPSRYDFCQALRLVEALNPDRPRLGRSARAAEDSIRLRQEPSMAFAPRTLAAFRAGGGGKPAQLDQFFFGLFGPNGPLPLHLTEFAHDRKLQSRDATFSRFGDIFHHRMLSFFYRAWADARPTVNFDRPEEDRIAKYVGAVFGLGLPACRDRDAVPDHTKLYLAGRLALHTKPAEGLRAIVEEYLVVRTRVEEFAAAWMRIPDESRLCLGENRLNSTLGQSATIGESVLDCQHKFRLVCGPCSAEQLQRLLPSGPSLERLAALVRNYIGDELDWDLRLVVQKEEVPSVVLGTQGQLGWTSWLGNRTADTDADDVLIKPEAYGWGQNQNNFAPG